MSYQDLVQVCVGDGTEMRGSAEDFPSAFGNVPDNDLLEDLMEKLDAGEREVFCRAHDWFHLSSNNKKALSDHEEFKETRTLPYYVKVLLFKFRTVPNFSL